MQEHLKIISAKCTVVYCKLGHKGVEIELCSIAICKSNEVSYAPLISKCMPVCCKYYKVTLHCAQVCTESMVEVLLIQGNGMALELTWEAQNFQNFLE